MSLSHAIAELYRRQIDCGIESYQGTGVIAWVVDERNRRLEKIFDVECLEAVGDWLLEEPRRREHSEGKHVHEMLGELANSQRKDPKRVDERRRTNTATGRRTHD